MKKLIATSIVCLLAGVVANAQGTVNFANIGAGVNAPVHLSDGVTKLNGANYQAILLAGASAGALTQVGTATPFLSGGNAGYFNGGPVTINSVTPGSTGFFEIIAWDSTLGGTTTGATAAQAFAAWQGGKGNVWGASGYVYGPGGGETPFSNTTGGVGTPASPPVSLSGLPQFNLAPPVPEPSTFALAGLGAAALMIFRRRK